MNIEQILRDAIESKTAKILKEEYGIEMSKEVIDEMSEEHDEPNKNCGVYLFKAYIPKGTEFFVSDDYKTIAATKLYITSQWATKDFGLKYRELYKIIVDGAKTEKR